jgi:hypothetical protein
MPPPPQRKRQPRALPPRLNLGVWDGRKGLCACRSPFLSGIRGGGGGEAQRARSRAFVKVVLARVTAATATTLTTAIATERISRPAESQPLTYHFVREGVNFVNAKNSSIPVGLPHPHSSSRRRDVCRLQRVLLPAAWQRQARVRSPAADSHDV